MDADVVRGHHVLMPSIPAPAVIVVLVVRKNPMPRVLVYFRAADRTRARGTVRGFH